MHSTGRQNRKFASRIDGQFEMALLQGHVGKTSNYWITNYRHSYRALQFRKSPSYVCNKYFRHEAILVIEKYHITRLL